MESRSEMPHWIQIRTDADRRKVQGWVSKAPPGTSIAFRRPNKRTQNQNDLMWPWLRVIAAKVQWNNEYLTEEDWKTLFTAALRGYRLVPGLENGMVQLGAHTSNFTKEEMMTLLDYIEVFAFERGVKLPTINYDDRCYDNGEEISDADETPEIV